MFKMSGCLILPFSGWSCDEKRVFIQYDMLSCIVHFGKNERNILFGYRNNPFCWRNLNILSLYFINPLSHVFVGPLSPGAALIVKSCDTNFSENIICITVKNVTISLWLWDYWKVVPNLKSELKKRIYIYI